MHTKTMHRLAAAAVLLSAKLSLENYYTNVHFAKVAGIKAAEVNKLECALLRALDCNLHIPDDEINSTLSDVSPHRAASDPALPGLLAMARPLRRCPGVVLRATPFHPLLTLTNTTTATSLLHGVVFDLAPPQVWHAAAATSTPS